MGDFLINLCVLIVCILIVIVMAPAIISAVATIGSVFFIIMLVALLATAIFKK